MKIVEKNKICKRKDDFCRTLVTDGLLVLGYDVSVCKSRWEKSSSYPAGNFSLLVCLAREKNGKKFQVPRFLVLKKTNSTIFGFIIVSFQIFFLVPTVPWKPNRGPKEKAFR